MKTALINSALMPNPGLTYRPRVVSADEFAALVRRAVADGSIESFIGYEATAAAVERLTGWRPPLSRAQTTVQAGDVMLVIKLKYRLDNAGKKSDPSFQNQVNLEDFEFWVVEVS